jgi:hypothetical protein
MLSRLFRFSLFLLLILALTACNLPGQNEPFPTSESTALPDLAATLTALAPAAQPSATALPDLAATLTALAPTPTLAPTVAPAATNDPAQQGGGAPAGIPVVQITPIATLGSNPVPQNPAPTVPRIPLPSSSTRIAFDRFATSKVTTGSLAFGEIKNFVLQVGGGQILMVSVGSPNNNVFLRIVAENGTVLLDPGMGIGPTSWQGRIFVTQDITVQVIDRGAASDFTLSTIIPEVITFEPGAVSATRAYPIAARDLHSFTLRALAGQTMSVWVTSSNGIVLLGIYGYDDGQPYKRSSVGDPSYSFQLPQTQDYVIQVFSASDTPADFTLQVTVQ